MLRVAMLSYWHVHAPGYTKEIQQIPETKITAVWDEIPTRGQEWAAKVDAAFVADLAAAVNRADVDAVIVNAPTNRHAEVMVAAARAGKHIFTEKILALTVGEADAIAAAVREAEVQFCISFPQRIRPEVLYLKQAIESGWLGQVTLLRTRIAHTGTIDRWLPPHFLDPQECGGGALIDLGAHPVYCAEYLMGMPEVVTARFSRVAPDLAVEDNAVVTMEYANGSLTMVEASFSSRFSPFTIEAHGTEGTAFFGFPGAPLLIRSRKLAGADNWIAPEPLPKALPSALNQWVQAIRGGAPPVFDLQAGRNLTELMQAANIAAREERPVRLPL